MLALLLIALPLARGGVGNSARLGAVGVASFALLLLARRRLGLPWHVLPLGAVLGIVAFQLAPLPIALHGLSPGARSLFQTVLAPIGLYPAPRPLSLDPPATALELADCAAGLAAFAAAWSVGVTRRGRELVLATLPASGAVVASVVLGRALAGTGTLLAPTFPFVNPNHLAGFMCLTSLAALGLALREHGQARLLWLVCFTASASTVVFTLSRGGIAALLAGLAVFAGLTLRRSRESKGLPEWSRLPLAVGLSVVVALGAWLALRPLLREFESMRPLGEEDKTSLWTLAVSMVRDFPLLGVGRGAFGTSFAAYKTDLHQVTWTHLENEWLQAFAELGIPGAILLIGAVGLAWLAAARQREGSLADAGLLAGVAAVALQNLVDFSLHLVGVSVPFMAALGLAMRGQGARRPGAVLPVALALALGIGGSAALLVGRAHLTQQDGDAVARLVDPDAAVQAATVAAGLHPADWLPHAAAGQRLVEADRCRDAMPWLMRAMLLNPTAPQPHLYAARCLAAAGQARAAQREYRLAISLGAEEAVGEVIERFDAVSDLLAASPDGPDGLLLLGTRLLPDRPAEAVTVLGRLRGDFGDPRATLPLAKALIGVGEYGAALTLARQRSQAAPGDVAAWALAAEALLREDHTSEGIEELRRGVAANPGSPVLLGVLAEQAIRSRRFAEARKYAADIAARTPAELSTKNLLTSRAYAGQGLLTQAIAYSTAARDAYPGVAAPLQTLANQCEAAGRLTEAIEALTALANLPHQDRLAIEERITSIRALATTRALRALKP